MKSVSGKALCKIVERYGWELKRVTGSHHIYAHEDIRAILSIRCSWQSGFAYWYFKETSEGC